MTEPLSEPLPDEERPKAPGSYGGRVALTAVLLALYLAGHQVDLPWVHPDKMPDYGIPQIPLTLFILGLTPLMTGFLLVELFSLMTARGRRLRTGGTAGRARLNRAALITSLVTSAVQALGIAFFLENVSASVFGAVVDQPGWLFRLLLVATLAGVTAALFVLGNLLSDHGIGNGFALLVLASSGWEVWWEGVAVRSELAEDTLPPALGIFVATALVALLIRYIRSTEATGTPPFPQGILPVQWSVPILSIPWLVELLGYQAGNFNLGFLLVLPIAIVLLSWLTFHLFSSRPRIEANLPDTMEGIYRIEDILERRLKPAAALLALGPVALFAWNAWQPHSTFTTWVVFLDLIFFVTIALDVWDQYRFLRRHGQAAHLIQLDNVHLSYRLAARLRDEGIDVLARAQRFRSLYFFFGALIKIDVFVPGEQLDRARAVWGELEASPKLIV